ncbi:helix-turn-helix domain-containing protein [Pelagibacterium sp. 26DY04]|uniref:hypothetical protein n=1 Tax=Pelagibacterium sp. 26DY04 TaxID=2967130 RepID=UPI00281597E6|nr:hypothetical protein [Pelagibacterium sp. 26DY04]WMT88584.1 helix-turn-helix domain-containing protein [Pelagibacterium sp. 26DY04]
MTAKLLLPFALISALALAACEERAGAPDVPNPDAGDPEAFAEPAEENEEPTSEEVMSPAELQQRREEIEQDAQQTFETIMEDTEQAGDNLMQLGDDAMNALSEGITSTTNALEVQIDALVASAAELRDENMTKSQKLEIVANVRNAAEQAARALGQSEAEITAAGDNAEERAREVLGVQTP